MMSHTHKQAGISLMLAVLILSAISAIAFSLATIVLIELRSSGDVVRTEPNLYAAFGVTEEALFQYKRQVPAATMDVVNCTPASLKVCSLNNVTLSLPAVNGQSQPITREDTPLVKVITAGSKVEIPMYQPNDYTQTFGRLKIDILPGNANNLQVSFRKTSQNGTVTYDPVSSAYSVVYGTPFVYTAFVPGTQYDLIIDNSGAGSKDVSISLSTYSDTAGTNPRGIPFIGQVVLKVVADYLGLSRTYRVQIPLTGSSNASLTNVAASTAGAVASASSIYNPNPSAFPIASVNNGDRSGSGWGSGTGGWNDGTQDAQPDWVQIDFAGSKNIDEIDVFTLPDGFPVEPTLTTTATTSGISDYDVQYWNGSSWVTIPGGSITNNGLAWRQIAFSQVTTTKIRVYITGYRQSWSRLVELEAYGY